MSNTTPGHGSQSAVPERDSAEAASEADGASGITTGEGKARGAGKGTKRQTRKEKIRRHQSRMAKQFPDGPEAKAKAAAEPKMPAELRQKIEAGLVYDLWNQAFEWSAAHMRHSARKRKNWTGERLAAEFCTGFDALVLTEPERKWLADWFTFLSTDKQLVRGPKFGPGKVIEALGVRSKADCIFDQMDALDTLETVSPLLTQGQALAQESASPIEAGQRTGSQTPTLFSMPTSQMSAEEASIMSLPPKPRTVPFKFVALQAESAKVFWRAYWESNDFDEIAGKARDFVADKTAVAEITNLGIEAKKFLDQTMMKLGVTLT